MTHKQADSTEAEVISAFLAARRAGRPAFECYKAGVDAWKRLHPEHASEYAGRQAVKVMLATVEDELLIIDEDSAR